MTLLERAEPSNCNNSWNVGISYSLKSLYENLISALISHLISLKKWALVALTYLYYFWAFYVSARIPVFLFKFFCSQSNFFSSLFSYFFFFYPFRVPFQPRWKTDQIRVNCPVEMDPFHPHRYFSKYVALNSEEQKRTGKKRSKKDYKSTRCGLLNIVCSFPFDV